ncbi:MAG: hypothetical protein V4480_00540 [Patescibacteria group bacterium]
MRPTPWALAAFRVSHQHPESDHRDRLLKDGVPVHLIDQLCATHATCRLRLLQMELKINYSAIPHFNKWISCKKTFGRGDDETAEWFGFVRRIEQLETELGAKKPRAARLRAKLNKVSMRRG